MQVKNDNKKLHIVFGTHEPNYAKFLSDELIKQGYGTPIIVIKTLKESIFKYLNENSDVDILIVSEYLESNNGFTVNDFSRCLDLVDKLLIVPILTDERKNSDYVDELYKQQILTALFGEAQLSDIVQLIMRGRSRVEARDYYGVNIKLMVGSRVDYEACITYILNDGEPEKLHERCEHVKSKVTANDYATIMSMLPKETMLLLKGTSDDSDLRDIVTKEKNTNKSKETKNSLNSYKEVEEQKVLAVNASLQEAVRKVVIGFAGSQEHIGVTYQVLLFAHYLSERGYKVAVVEDESQKSLSFLSILRSNSSIEVREKYFIYKDVHYYQKYDLKELARVMLNDYNFVLIDFGLYRESIMAEFNRCILPIIVTGSRLWEMPQLERIFDLVDDDNILNGYYYLFTFAHTSARKKIKKNMGSLSRVYFADFIANPMAAESYQAMTQILERYLPTTPKDHKGNTPLSKFRRLFE